MISITFKHKFVRKMIVSFMRSHYGNANQSLALRWIMQVVFNELQYSFREDNIPTTIDFMVEEIVGVSHLPPASSMCQKLIGTKALCTKCKGETVNSFGDCCSQ